jgi:hypothetical protein
LRVIVCGSRDYTRKIMVNVWLDGLYEQYGEKLFLIQGGAKGADALAKQWAKDKFGRKYLDKTLEYKADWKVYGKGAGAVRNEEMLKDGLLIHDDESLVLAFKDDFNWNLDRGGSEHMVKIAKAAGVPTFVIQKA